MSQGNHAPLHAGVSHLAFAADEPLEPRLERFLLLREVEAATGLKRSVIYAKMKLGEFPRQIRLTGKPGAKQFRSAWIEREVIQWQRAYIAARDRLAEAGFVPGVPARMLPAARERAQTAAQRARERRAVQRLTAE
jgi:predicted DNA-binding transcriptional regulator AlpA